MVLALNQAYHLSLKGRLFTEFRSNLGCNSTGVRDLVGCRLDSPAFSQRHQWLWILGLNIIEGIKGLDIIKGINGLDIIKDFHIIINIQPLLPPSNIKHQPSLQHQSDPSTSPSPSILHIQHQHQPSPSTSNINTSSISNIKHQTSNIKHQTSNIKHQTSNIKHQTSNINIKHQTSTSNINIKHQHQLNIKQENINIKHQTSTQH
ncbi:hypothetical protein J1614_007571 [Plenodomus biglobosus]|nr:hypothetical protein J1614_007571 [Plenodomus biglobosus]